MRPAIQPSKTDYKKSLVALIIGILALIIGIGHWVIEKNYESGCTETVQGVVLSVDSNYVSGKNCHWEYTPHVYYNYSGNDYEYSVRNPFRSDYYTAGENVVVKLDPEEPSKCYLAKEGEFFTLFRRTWQFFLLAVTMIIVGGFGMSVFKERY